MFCFRKQLVTENFLHCHYMKACLGNIVLLVDAESNFDNFFWQKWSSWNHIGFHVQ